MPPQVAQNDDPFAGFEAESSKLGLLPTDNNNSNVSTQSFENPFASFEAEANQMGLIPSQEKKMMEEEETIGGVPKPLAEKMKKFVHARGAIDNVSSGVDLGTEIIKRATPQDLKNLAYAFSKQGEALASGVLSAADFLTTTPLNAMVNYYNSKTGDKVPTAKPASEQLENFVDSYIGDEKGALYEGIKSGGRTIGPAGLLRKAGGLLAGQTSKDLLGKAGQTLTSLGTKNPTAITGAIAGGSAGEIARQQGSGDLASAGVDLGTDIIVQALTPIISKISGNPAGMLANIIGVGEKHLDKKAAESAKVLKMDLPITAASKSSQIATANQTLSKTPIVHSTIEAVKQKAHEQYQTAYQELLNKVSPELKSPWNEAVEQVYSKVNKLFRPNDKIDFSDAVKSAEELLKKTDAATMSPATIAVRKHALDIVEYAGKDSYLIKELKNTPAFISATPETKQNMLKSVKEVNPQDTEKLASAVLRTKIELNKIMKDKNIFTRDDKDSLDLLTTLQAGIKSSLNKYGNKYNPEWNEAFKVAEKQYGQMAKRKGLENLLSEIMYSAKNEGSPVYHSLVDIFSKRLYKGELVNALGSEQYKNVEHFLNVAKAMQGINKRVPNPSGTATLSLLYSAVSGIASGTLLTGPGLAWGGLGGLYTFILSSPKATEIATKFAKKPTESLAREFNEILQANTGLGIREIMKYDEKSKD